ncbi:MAG TPA: hypothetical protein VF789_17705 [Thermoanaerobaculia bacterium]
MTPAERQKRLLMVLGVLALILAWRYGISPLLSGGGDVAVPTRPAAGGGLDEDGPAPPAAASAGSGEESKGARPGDRVEILRVADLDRQPGPLVAGRDPWRFIDPPPPPIKPPPPPRQPTAEELAELERRRLAELERARLAAIEAAKPRPPEFTMEYLGYFGPEDKKIAVFTNGKNQINVLEGDRIQNQFIVERIGYESVDIRFVGFPDVPAKRVGVRRR